MIKALRKRHLQIWTLWSVLIPAGIISSILIRPVFPTDKLLQPTGTAALPVVIKSFNKENYTVNIRASNDTSQLQLEWINKRTLTYPTATIYEASPNPFGGEAFNPADSKLIGRIEARGNYHFALQKNLTGTTYRFIVYDFIHQQIIDSITF
jgi:hypothetical protein